MCGIVGYTGSRSCRGLLLEGLRHLEYRGYDSAGLSLVDDGGVESVHAVGKLSALEEAVAAYDERDGGNGGEPATAGIAHTRWATHGRVTQENAHPHDDPSGRVHIVMNGIVENWSELKRRLEAEGAEFSSETDTEVVAHLIASHLDDGLLEAVQRGLRRAARALLLRRDQRRRARPAGGRPQGDPAGGGPRRRRELLRLRRAGLPGRDAPGPVPRGRRDRGHDPRRGADLQRSTARRSSATIEEVDWDQAAAEKGGFETFMLKEIHEQPEAIAETVGDRLRPDGTLELTDLGISDDELRSFRRVLVVACGTSYHAGVVGPLRDRGVVGRPGGRRHRLGVPLPQAAVRRPRPGGRASPSRARPPTRWPRCAWRATAAPG